MSNALLMNSLVSTSEKQTSKEALSVQYMQRLKIKHLLG